MHIRPALCNYDTPRFGGIREMDTMEESCTQEGAAEAEAAVGGAATLMFRVGTGRVRLCMCGPWRKKSQICQICQTKKNLFSSNQMAAYTPGPVASNGTPFISAGISSTPSSFMAYPRTPGASLSYSKPLSYPQNSASYQIGQPVQQGSTSFPVDYNVVIQTVTVCRSFFLFHSISQTCRISHAGLPICSKLL
jgi:hypothetical protein